ncbi:hypothetical protein DEDE109153_18025 [Deinococcus deserti]|uniref:Uncharacterized protein n=1 Tax=Deinococcus deserti (strain DSM 17065 / CIP 109153 / LMG 22923 / VCD115) TaxID=546414 RepID=C1CZ65_DEIDV|nr:hypothetical protein [Deinococcus deserti]ACO45103.1 Hypothetical protein Deide_02853 [Deinococcus deserti VCD115]
MTLTYNDMKRKANAALSLAISVSDTKQLRMDPDVEVQGDPFTGMIFNARTRNQDERTLMIEDQLVPKQARVQQLMLDLEAHVYPQAQLPAISDELDRLIEELEAMKQMYDADYGGLA